MSKIASIRGLQILDSRGIPTIKATVTTESGEIGQASVPSGASTGEHEALELRDGDPDCFCGKGVLSAIESIHREIAPALIGRSVFDQSAHDRWMVECDGSPNKERLGANAILAVSLAIARAAASTAKLPLYRYLGGSDCHLLLPCPMFNVINGGVHADNLLNVQEFMIRPVGASCFSDALRWGSEIFHRLKRLLKQRGFSTAVGDEGGFAPQIEEDSLALELIVEAIESAGRSPGSEVSLALDCAASEFYDAKRGLYFDRKRAALGLDRGKERSVSGEIDYLAQICAAYPISSLEDPLDQNDWAGWRAITERLGRKLQIVGDDLFVTNTHYLRRGIEQSVANAILIKPNQIGTLSETIAAIEMAKRAGYGVVISHRSGETEDTFIADLSVGLGCGQIKSGATSRSERVAKYNRLLAIEEELGSSAAYASQYS
jgi:enolase